MPLTIVPTPIGNLEDMTLRGLRVLKEADLIACEDTRHTLQLLNHFDIKKPLISCHEYNERDRVRVIADRLEKGDKIALVSDAGTPGLSDPGALVAAEMSKLGYKVDVLPGANALLPALILSGITMESFLFVGFLKGNAEEKNKRLDEIKALRETLVFYMAPHRLIKELAFIGNVLGDREAVLVREISKIHQEVIHGTLCTFCDTIPEEKIRGEFVCVVSGAEETNETTDESKWQEEALVLLEAKNTTKNIAEILSVKYNIPKNTVKKYICGIKK